LVLVGRGRTLARELGRSTASTGCALADAIACSGKVDAAHIATHPNIRPARVGAFGVDQQCDIAWDESIYGQVYWTKHTGPSQHWTSSQVHFALRGWRPTLNELSVDVRRTLLRQMDHMPLVSRRTNLSIFVPSGFAGWSAHPSIPSGSNSKRSALRVDLQSPTLVLAVVIPTFWSTFFTHATLTTCQ